MLTRRIAGHQYPFLNKAAFQLVPVSSASGRTIRRGYQNSVPLREPSYVNVDLSIGKNFSLTENKTLEFKADMQNALNQTNYTTVSTNMNAVNFGEITGTAGARVIQVQLRLAF